MELVVLILIFKTVSAFPPLQISDPTPFSKTIEPASKIRRLSPTPKLVAIGQSELLPLLVNPESYILRIQPILEGQAEGSQKEWTAPGYVEIVVTTVNTTDRMILHKDKGITVDRSTLEVLDKTCQPIEIKEVEEDAEKQTYTVIFTQTLPINQVYTISMKFVTWITDLSIGLYRIYYDDSEKKNRPIATSQFQWNDARRAYPCFDEPRFKSIFTISIARKNGTIYHTLSNGMKKATGVTDPELPEGWVYDHYEDTLPAPTYLIGLMVLDYVGQEATSELYSKPVTIYAHKDAIEQKGAVFVADTSARLLPKYEELTLHPYELPKLESAAHSEKYFLGSGMENWGVIAYRFDRVMYFPGKTTIRTKAHTLDLIAHEVAHQWFGNIITCRYWSHLWINEGITTYMSYVTAELIYSEFKQRQYFLTREKQFVMNYDVGVNDSIWNLNKEINRIPEDFSFTYDKCASIIRMLEGILGFDVLLKCLQELLKRFSYKTIESVELFKVFQDIAGSSLPAGKTFEDILRTWLNQAGYPLVRIDGKTITQEPFTRKGEPPLGDFKWEIPLFVSIQSDPTPKVQWVHKEGRSLCQQTKADEWMILNHDSYGYYRVWYDDSTLRRIEQQLIDDSKKFSAMTRSQLIDDYFNFVEFGHTKIPKALDLLKYLARGEDEFTVWFAIFQNLGTARNIMLTKDPAIFQSVFAPYIDQTLKKVKWEQDEGADGTVVMFRARLMDWACGLESADCKTKSQEFFTKWKTNPQALFPPDIHPIMACAIVGFGAQDAYDFVFERFQKADSDSDKVSHINALCCTKKKENIEKLISQSLDPNSEVSPFMQSVLVNLAANTEITRFMFGKMQEDAIFQKLKSVEGGIGAFWETFFALSEFINENSELSQIKTFLEKHASELEDPDKVSTEHVLGNIGNNIDWIKKHYDLFKLWLIGQSDIGR